MLATANLGKNVDEWTGRVEISKEEIPGSRRSMQGYALTYSRLQRENLKLCVLNRWDFNFCVCSSPLQSVKQHDLKKVDISLKELCKLYD